MKVIEIRGNILTFELSGREWRGILEAIVFSRSTRVSELDRNNNFDGVDLRELEELVDPGAETRALEFRNSRKQARSEGKKWKPPIERNPNPGPKLLTISKTDLLNILKIIRYVITNSYFLSGLYQLTIDDFEKIEVYISAVLAEES